jgi:hypothetical protein
MVYHIREGCYGDTRLDDFSVMFVAEFDGNVWAGETKITFGLVIDGRADDVQREALRTVFSGQAGGFMANFARVFGEVRGIEYAPISFAVADDLASWRAEVPGMVKASAEALTGPTTPPGARVQLHNPPGSETGPGQIVTWGTATENLVNAYGFQWNWAGKSSKHIPFDWSGPA